MKVLELLNGASGILSQHGVDSPRLDAELLLARSLRMNREGLYVHFNRPVGEKERGVFEDFLRRRISGEPLPYIVNHREFWSVDFKVDARVFIPRPETELLVEESLRILQQMSNQRVPSVLELGTGSGAIAIAIAREAKDIFLVATDISSEALGVARENARMAEVDQIHFVNGDLFGPFRMLRGDGFFDLIVSNPPYVSRREMETLAREVREYEPSVALDGGEDGLDFYRTISTQAASYLRKGGWLLLEVGQHQGIKVSEMIERTGAFESPERFRDFAEMERVVKAQKRARNRNGRGREGKHRPHSMPDLLPSLQGYDG